MKRTFTTILLVLLVGTVILWAYGLRVEAMYDGPTGNDCQQHRVYVDATYRALQAGKLPLELWGDHCCLGSPIFRMYQYLPHLLAASLMKFVGFGASQSMHFLIVVFWLLQFPLGLLAARLLGAPWTYALSVAILTPLISSVGLGAQSLNSYSINGIGMFAQATGAPFLYLCLALSLVVTGWTENRSRIDWPKVLGLGLTMGLTFHFHHYMGLLAAIIYATLASTGLLFRWVRFRDFVVQGLFLGGFFLLVGAHQFWSMWQDNALVFQNTWDRPELWKGFGAAGFFELLLSGQFFDLRRTQVLSGLLLIGSVFGLSRTAPRFLKGILLLSAVMAVFCIGPGIAGETVGHALRFLQPERFLVAFHISAIFIAAYGLSWLLTESSGLGLQPRALTLLIPFITLGLVAFAHRERLAAVKQGENTTRSQIQMNREFDKEIFSAMGSKETRARYWADPQWAETRWGAVPYQGILAEAGFPHVTIAEHSMSYGTEMTHHFDPRRATDYSIFNVNRIIVNDSQDEWMQIMRRFQGPLPEFLVPKYRARGVLVLESPYPEGMWGIITVPKVQFTPDALRFRDEVGNWLRKASLDSYPAIMPEAMAKKWPWAVPTKLGTGVPGKVIQQSYFEDGQSSAEFDSPDDLHYAVLRMSFHPHWEFRVNGELMKPQWVAPGYAAVLLPKGKSQVSAVFTEDPLRILLFQIGWVSFGLIGVIFSLLLIPFPRRRRQLALELAMN